MTDKPIANITLGLELTGRELKGAIISYQQNKLVLNQVFSIDVNREASTAHNVKLLYNDIKESEFTALLNKCLVVTPLKTSDVLIRPLEVELTKEYDIDQVLEFQAEPLIPYNLEEGLIDRIILEKKDESTDLTIVMARKTHISEHLETMHSIDVEPEVISCKPAALASFAKHFSPIEGAHIVLNVGVEETTCVLVNMGKLITAQSTNIGTAKLIEALSLDIKKGFLEASDKFTTLKASDLEKNAEFQKTFKSFENEVVKLCFALSQHSLNHKISEILLVGDSVTSKALAEILSSKLKKKIVVPEDRINSSLKSADLQKYACSIGLAITAIPKEKDQINFRQKEFIFPNPWKRIKQPMFIYFSLCLGLFISVYLFSIANLASKKDDLRKQYVELLAFMKMPFQELEDKFANKYTEFEVLSLTKEDIKMRLNLLEKELLKTPDIFPLLPNIPKVVDVLAWLSINPNLISTNGNDQPRISLNNFSYKLIKRPELNKMNEKYQVKVELSFTSLKPRYAREFHDALLTPNDMIDPKGEVKWNVEKDGYRTSFFLKDATRYPSR